MSEETHFTKEDRKTLTLVESHVFDMKQTIAQMAISFAERAELNAIEKRVAGLEEDKKWLIRSIVGAVLMAVLSFVLITK